MPRYGQIHRICDFVHRMIPKRTASAQFLLCAVDFLKTLDSIQEHNPFVTLSIQTGDGMWIYYKLQRLYFVHPAQQHMRLLIFENPESSAKSALLEMINRARKNSNLFSKRKKKGAKSEWQWWIGKADLERLARFTEKKLVRPNKRMILTASTHPRNFAAEDRQVALQVFERSGFYCPGYVRRKRHKVNPAKDPIEFDHILPHSRGGSNSVFNVQVMCSSCNRKKHNRAA